MDKIEVRRDHLMYLICELNAVRRDKQDLAERVDHVHSCLCAIAGFDALKNDRIDQQFVSINNIQPKIDAARAKAFSEFLKRECKPGGSMYFVR